MAVAGAIALAALDLDRLIDPIRREVVAASGRELAVRGGISWALLPEPAIILKEVSVANAPWGHARALVSARRVEARIALAPLLARRLRIVRLDVIDPQIALETDGRGRGNWEFEGAGAPPSIDRDAATRWSLDELVLRDGTITFESGRAASSWQGKIDVLALRARDATAPIEGELRGVLEDVPVALTVRLASYEALVARKWPYAINLSGEIAGRKGSISAGLTAEQGSYAFDGVSLAYGPHGVRGRVVVSAGPARPSIVVHVATKAIRVAELFAKGGVPAVAPPDRPWIPAIDLPVRVLPGVDLDLRVEAGALTWAEGWQLTRVDARLVASDGYLDALALTGSGFGGPITAQATLGAARGEPELALQVLASDVDPGAVLGAWGAQTQVRGARGSLAADFVGHGRSLRAWARSVDGRIDVRIGPGALLPGRATSQNTLDQLTVALLQPSAGAAPIDFACAVAELTFTRGRAQTDHSFAFETTSGGASASGTIDLGTESLELDFRGWPARSGKGERVRLEGSLASPRVVAVSGASQPAAPRPPSCAKTPAPATIRRH